MRACFSVVVLCLTIVAVLLGSASRSFADSRPNRVTQDRILVDSHERRYLLHVPRSYVQGTSVPLVLVFHGGKQSASDMQKLTGLNLISADEGFIVAYPEALDEQWNQGGGAGDSSDGSVDVTFTARLVAKLSALYSIDPQRIYAVGYSTGGMMVLKLACSLPGLFAGISTVAASFPAGLATTCEPPEPVSLLMINGTDDAVIPWFGANPDPRHLSVRPANRPFLSAEETARFWAKRASCGSTPSSRRVIDLDVKNMSYADEYSFRSCRPGIEVAVYSLVGVGHDWPSPNLDRVAQLLAQRTLGTQLHNFDVPRLIWKFFGRQRRIAQ